MRSSSTRRAGDRRARPGRSRPTTSETASASPSGSPIVTRTCGGRRSHATSATPNNHAHLRRCQKCESIVFKASRRRCVSTFASRSRSSISASGDGHHVFGTTKRRRHLAGKPQRRHAIVTGRQIVQGAARGLVPNGNLDEVPAREGCWARAEPFRTNWRHHGQRRRCAWGILRARGEGGRRSLSEGSFDPPQASPGTEEPQ